jgi:rod shape determining protein RodA
MPFSTFGQDNNSIFGKVKRLEWGLYILLALLTCYGTILLYGAAGGNWQPWALDHITRFTAMSFLMIAVAMVDIRFWYYIAYPAYAATMVLIVGVEVAGEISMGAQRWLRLGPVRLQPSEFMKISIILALARYYQDLNVKNIGALKHHIIPIIMALAPATLIMKQPDLGTGSVIALEAAILILLAGVSWRWVITALTTAIIGGYVGFTFFMHDFQRKRILTFLNPERDPLGEGYQITQSKIAIGSGGVFGVGYMRGTQSQLDFLPERHTDFVFAMLLEEFGIIGGLLALALYLGVIGFGVFIAITSRNYFGKLLASGISILIFIYVSINAAMIMGLMPVVGMPMPLLSYGGSVMLSIMFAIGLVQNVKVNRDKTIGTNLGSRQVVK